MDQDVKAALNAQSKTINAQREVIAALKDSLEALAKRLAALEDWAEQQAPQEALEAQTVDGAVVKSTPGDPEEDSI